MKELCFIVSILSNYERDFCSFNVRMMKKMYNCKRSSKYLKIVPVEEISFLHFISSGVTKLEEYVQRKNVIEIYNDIHIKRLFNLKRFRILFLNKSETINLEYFQSFDENFIKQEHVDKYMRNQKWNIRCIPLKFVTDEIISNFIKMIESSNQHLSVHHFPIHLLNEEIVEKCIKNPRFSFTYIPQHLINEKVVEIFIYQCELDSSNIYYIYYIPSHLMKQEYVEKFMNNKDSDYRLMKYEFLNTKLIKNLLKIKNYDYDIFLGVDEKIIEMYDQEIYDNYCDQYRFDIGQIPDQFINKEILKRYLSQENSHFKYIKDCFLTPELIPEESVISFMNTNNGSFKVVPKQLITQRVVDMFPFKNKGIKYLPKEFQLK